MSEFGRYVRWAEHAVVAGVALYGAKKLCEGPGLAANLTRLTVQVARQVPGAAAIVKKQQAEALEQIEKFVLGQHDDDHKVHVMPERGTSPEELMERLREWRGKEKEFQCGKAFGGIYHDGEEHEQLIRDALALYADSNALYPSIFPGLRKFEAELVSITVQMLHGGEEGCGAVTSGGTESILMAAKIVLSVFGKAYRDRGKALYGIVEPEMLIPTTAHAAFLKAAHYFGIKPVMVDVEGEYQQRVDIAKVRALMNPNVVMVIGSAPTFPHGCIDDIESLSAVVQQWPHAGLHVDTCLGGFILPWLTELGHVKKKFDFSLPGVTSMSADVHKYGFGPKGVSVICWRSPAYRRFQYFTYCDWSGGLYCSPAFQGSRAGGPIAAAWASTLHLGRDGFLECAQGIWKTFTTIRDGINNIDGLRVICDPDACSIAWISTASDLDIFKVADAMAQSQWSVNRLQVPRCLQIQIGFRETFQADQFLECLRDSVRRVRTEPEAFEGGVAGIYGLAANLASAKEVDTISDILHSYMDVLLRV